VEGQAPESDDSTLLRRSAAGDAKAFHALMDRHAERLYRLAVSLVGGRFDAEDIVQETFVGAFKGMKGFQERASVKTWLTRILVMQVARWRRDQKRHRRVHGSEVETEPATGSLSGAVEARLDLMEAVGRLSPEHRDVVVLRELEQLSYEEMAAVLGVPRGTVESRLHRARGELRERLRAYRI
jgi:RNA polymerase sigma-70 factor (ECF subfamily)